MSIVHQEPLSLFDGKACFKCGLWKPLSDYAKRARYRDGLHYQCKDCDRLRRVSLGQGSGDPNAYSVRYYREHKDAMVRYACEYHKQHPEYKRSMYHTKLAQKYGVGGKFSAKDWVALKARYDYRCLCCGKQEPEIKLTVDHVIPYSKGGPNTIDNIQPLCQGCNSIKSVDDVDFRLLW